jgi:hypothetical protein
MIIDRAHYQDGRRRDQRAVPLQEAATRCGQGGFVWLGLFEPGEEELAQVGDTFGLHELAVEDAQNFHMRPKIESYDQDVRLVILRTAGYDDAAEEVEFGEISVFLAPTFVITVRHRAASELRGARQRLEQRPELLAAGSSSALSVRKGEAFDTETGLPKSAVREHESVTWFDLACRFVDLKWPHLAAKSRASVADALATVTPVLVTTRRGMPDQKTLRAALYGWAFHKERRNAGPPDEETAAAISWIRANTLKVVTLDEKDRRSELIRQALDALSLTMDGKPAAATVVARKRSVFYGVLNYAVELDMLPANPVDKVR